MGGGSSSLPRQLYRFKYIFTIRTNPGVFRVVDKTKPLHLKYAIFRYLTRSRKIVPEAVFFILLYIGGASPWRKGSQAVTNASHSVFVTALVSTASSAMVSLTAGQHSLHFCIEVSSTVVSKVSDAIAFMSASFERFFRVASSI